MARTPSTMMLELGSAAPAFTLPDYGAGVPAGRQVSLDQIASPGGKARAFLVMFICNHCPFVKHVRHQLAQLGKDYTGKVGVVGINPNDVANYPDDRPELMTVEAKAAGYTFPYLYDATQEIAKAYKAACTPDVFLFDAARRLVYRGQLDDSRPGNNIPVTGKDLRAAMDAVLASKPAPQPQRPSMGCNIKWMAGSEPDYFLNPA
jgi:thiol-disulfide isomerase/thioredoxin